jgi:hypothetical protein
MIHKNDGGVMVPANIQDALLNELKELTPENGSRLLEVARSMKAQHLSEAPTLDEVLHNLPVWDEERAQEMESIIEDGCEQIDLSRW